jgi:hypothetical protein
MYKNANDILFLTSVFAKIATSKEALLWAPFGEYAWSKYREGVPEEADNELETLIYQQIKKHFASTNRTGLPQMTAALLSLLMKIGWYKDVLHPPPVKKLYRGLKIRSKQQLSDLTGIPTKELENSGSVNLNKPVPHDNGFSTSWTFKKKITQDFSTNYGKAKSGFATVLVANVDDNPYKFIAGPGGLYDVDGLSRWHLEKETIGLEPITIASIEWEIIS